ncbi:M60 family metallopeptidase [Serratia sp. D1N4]
MRVMKILKLLVFSVLGIVLSIILPLNANAAALEPNEAIWPVPHIYEQRDFKIKGKGIASEVASSQLRESWATWSRYEPTGIYTRANETLTINVSSKANVFAYIQSYALYGSSNSWDEKSFKLQPGKNIISSPKGGVLYLSNEEGTGDVAISVQGGSHIPVFEKYHHSMSDLMAMLDKYKNAPYVEFISERGLITATYGAVAQYYLQKNATDPVTLLERLDIVLAAQDHTAGYDEQNGPNKQDHHYRHMIQDTKSSLYMYTKTYRTAYVNNSINAVLDGFISKAWGPMHENGHQQQSLAMNFNQMTEVTVNIYSLAAEKLLGQTSRLESEDIYARIFEYLDRPQQDKDYIQIEDLFVKLGMLHQLSLSFGDQFYPRLHREYREKNRTEINVYGKEQIFIYMASKVSGYDLTPFFAMWGLLPSNDTKAEIKKLNLDILTQEIWKSTDSNPVIVPSLRIQADKISLTLSNEVFSSNQRFVVYHNGQYAFETYAGKHYYSQKDTSNPYVTTVVYVKNKPSYGDKIDVYLVPGTPGQPIDFSASTHLISKIHTGDISLNVSDAGFESTMDIGLFNSKTRILFLYNGKYLGETYNGVSYYLANSKTNQKLNIFNRNPLYDGDKIEIYKVPGQPGERTNISEGVLLASQELLTAPATPEKFDDISLDNISFDWTATGFTVSLPSDLFYSDQRVVLTKNGQYLGEFYQGIKYYLTLTHTNPNIVTITQNVSLNPKDEILLYVAPGSPGMSADVYQMSNLLLKKVFN